VPIPIIDCGKCGAVPVPEDQLPVLLPDDVDYRPQGMPPLASSPLFMDVTCPNCHGPAKRDPETLDTFVDSSWYFFRYTDPHNDKQFASPEKIKEWMPVKLYVIGAEHTVLHLLYSRFITKFLMDQGHFTFKEPFLKLRHQGLIQGSDGLKMSKSRGNVVNPDEVVDSYGADTVRVYEMFMGPFEDGQPWDTNGIVGVSRFIEKFSDYFERYLEAYKREPAAIFGGDRLKPTLHKTIKKVTNDIKEFKFNTAISQLMILMNSLRDSAEGSKGAEAGIHYRFFDKTDVESVLKIVAPFAPHLTEELWERLGHDTSIHLEPWPQFDPSLIADAEVTIAVQVMGKLRGTVKVKSGASQDEVKQAALADLHVKSSLEGKEVVKDIFVPDRLINFVTK
jgi:leucyl-tRNA synthetase